MSTYKTVWLNLHTLLLTIAVVLSCGQVAAELAQSKSLQSGVWEIRSNMSMKDNNLERVYYVCVDADEQVTSFAKAIDALKNCSGVRFDATADVEFKGECLNREPHRIVEVHFARNEKSVRYELKSFEITPMGQSPEISKVDSNWIGFCGSDWDAGEMRTLDGRRRNIMQNLHSK